MRATGLIVVLSGFAGIPGFLVAGLSGTVTAGICTQVALVIICVILLIRQKGSVRAWLDQTSGAEYGSHPWIVGCAGMLFAAVGLYLIVYGNPTNDE